MEPATITSLPKLKRVVLTFYHGPGTSLNFYNSLVKGKVPVFSWSGNMNYFMICVTFSEGQICFDQIDQLNSTAAGCLSSLLFVFYNNYWQQILTSFCIIAIVKISCIIWLIYWRRRARVHKLFSCGFTIIQHYCSTEFSDTTQLCNSNLVW